MSAELCLHGADVWIKTLECQLRNFPGKSITRPPDMKNSSAGRHFPPFSILGTRTFMEKKIKSNKQTKKTCKKIQQTNKNLLHSAGKV